MKRAILLLLLLITVGGGIYFFGEFGARGRFPSLVPGSYIGEISGVDSARPQDTFSFYLERLTHAPVNLLVVMKEGWQPQLVNLEPLEVAPTDAGDIATVKPLQIENDGKRFTFTGTSWLGSFRGELKVSGGAEGRWSLHPIAKQQLSENLDQIQGAPDQFASWLTIRNQYVIVESQLKQTEQALQEASEKAGKLEKLLEEDSTLRSRASARREALTQEIGRLDSDQLAGEKALVDSVSELDLLGRITKRGKSVVLARKVANRENN